MVAFVLLNWIHPQLNGIGEEKCQNESNQLGCWLSPFILPFCLPSARLSCLVFITEHYLIKSNCFKACVPTFFIFWGEKMSKLVNASVEPLVMSNSQDSRVATQIGAWYWPSAGPPHCHLGVSLAFKGRVDVANWWTDLLKNERFWHGFVFKVFFLIVFCSSHKPCCLDLVY